MSLEYVTSGVGIARLAATGQPNWCGPTAPTPAAAVVVDGALLALRPVGTKTTEVAPGVFDDETDYTANSGLEIQWQLRRYPELAIVESRVVVRNVTTVPVTVDRLDSIVLPLDSADCLVRSFTSGWGLEFEGVCEPLTGTYRLESLAGRSSQGRHPYFALERPDGTALVGNIAWSGNWVVRLDPAPAGGHTLSAGLHDEGFSKTLAPGQQIEAPPVVLAVGDSAGVAVHLGRAGRRHWAPRNALAQALPVEWNHWWTYEDQEINEAVFRANAEVAAGLGVELCTLDAGWFGPADVDAQWTDHRGDWDLVNHQRFPGGLRALSDHVHGLGMRFGLWCEIEALGPKARLGKQRPDLPALRDGEPLGYVCLGNPAAAEWAVATLDQLIEAHGADWIKLDFNLDPGLGCNRTDHGHGPSDGLFEHYQGYYGVLTRIRSLHPEVVLENCSSGGLRIDLGMLRQTHLTFLSDPDWPEHGLQVLWGAAAALPPNQLLHWGWSQWRSRHAEQTLNPSDPALQPHQIDYYRRIAMLGATGMSYDLPDLPDRFRDRLAANIQTYKDIVRPFVRTADLHRLTGQPRRFGKGERWAGFQYSQPDADSHLVLLFRLPGGEAERTIPLRGLAENRNYRVDADTEEVRTGADLMTTGVRAALPEEGSAIIMVNGL